jgi:hypothetical protein
MAEGLRAVIDSRASTPAAAVATTAVPQAMRPYRRSLAGAVAEALECPASAPTVKVRSPADWKRAEGSFARQRSTMRASAVGILSIASSFEIRTVLGRRRPAVR